MTLPAELTWPRFAARGAQPPNLNSRGAPVPGPDPTYLKKSEANSKSLPPSELKQVTRGQHLALASPPTKTSDGQYYIVTLKK